MELPVIDMSMVDRKEKEIGGDVVNALQTVGFMCLDNVSGLDFDMLYKCCRWFFELPDSIKETITKQFWNPDNKNIYRGYSPILEGDPPFKKECFDFGKDSPYDENASYLMEKSVWPKEINYFPFKKYMLHFYDVMQSTSLEVIRLMEIGLGIPSGVMQRKFRTATCSSFRLLHYPDRSHIIENSKGKQAKRIALDDHTDSNFLTLLSTFHYRGLEILTQDDEWIEIKPFPKGLIVNLGDLCQKMTGGKFKPTRHRVFDIGVERFSVPFFLEPAWDCNVETNFLAHDSTIIPSGENTYDQWLSAKRKAKLFYEYQGLPLWHIKFNCIKGRRLH